MMFQYRVTKYDPARRNEAGHYLRDEWTAFDDVGRAFDGQVLTLADYERIEQAYIDSALEFMREAGIRSLSARGVENSAASVGAPCEGAHLDAQELPSTMRSILREAFWCRLESPAAFIHFGWDYYMYIGVPLRCESSCELARQRGLFVEPCESPYRADNEPRGNTS